MKELPVLEGPVEFALPGAAPLGPGEANRSIWEGGRATVEIAAPDRFCAHVFLELMGSLFPFELVGTGTYWVIRLQPRLGSAWERQLLLLVQRWLATCPLPCATIAWGGRKYLFRSALTHAGSAFDRPQALVPPRAAHGSKAKSRSSAPTARATTGRERLRQPRVAPVPTR